jgi:exopolysaccharide/PEP-CTERM locus tyrosine autokinase
MAAAEKEFAAAEKERERTAEIALANNITLNWAALEENGYLTPNNQHSVKAEEFRIIKRPLLRAAFNVEGRHKSIAHVAMVTSPTPRDGKTFTAANLAVSIAAERDLHVLLIDADIRNRGLSKIFGLADRPGLMELLTKPDMNVPSVLLRTDMANLAVIPAGQPIVGATEIFASQTMARLARDIATRYSNRFIIFDAPPVLASSEPGVLAAHVGQIVMVVRANETSKRAIAEAVALVNACPTVNFVLNQISLAAGPDRFGYYGKAVAPEARA